MGNIMKYFSIESKIMWDNRSEYRYYSLYNSAHGAWNPSKASAIKEGEQHEKIIKELFGTQGDNHLSNRVTLVRIV